MARGVRRGGAREVVVHPYLLGAAATPSWTLPRQVDEAAARFQASRSRVTAPLGVHPDLAAIELERCGVPAVRRATLPGFTCPGDVGACAAPWCGPRE
jgi:sirohydrochlorin ferrochelatase